MTVFGFVTNGECNSIYTQESEWPVSVIQLLMDRRQEAKSTSQRNKEISDHQ